MLRRLKDKQAIIFVMGGPGSGKGTQCSKLQAYNYHHIAMGDILRKMIEENKKKGPNNRDPKIDQIEADMKAGVSSDGTEAIEIIKKEMEAHPEAVGFLIDGYPRTPPQLARFEREIGSCDKVLYLDTTEEIMQQRILERANQAHRVDDTKNIFARRIQQFKENTQPLIEILRQRNTLQFLQIDTSGEVDETTQDILFALTAPKISLIGLAGQSGSGKTTIAKKLAEQIGLMDCVILSIDNYYKDLSHLPLEERKKCNFDHPDSLDFDLLSQHLDDLKQGKSISVPIYDFNTMTRSTKTIPIDPKKIIIIEGILALYPEDLLSRYDAKIFIDTDADLCLGRRILRDMSTYRPVEDIIARYEKDVKPMFQQYVAPTKSKADIVFNNNQNEKTNYKAKLYAHIISKVVKPAPVLSNSIHRLFPTTAKPALVKSKSLPALRITQ